MPRIGRFLTTLALVTLGAAPTAGAAGGGTIQALEGRVQARAAARPQWVPARLRQLCREGDSLRTGRNSRAEIAYTDGTVTRLAPHSFLTIKERESFGRLLLGKLWFKVTKQHAPIRIQTPSAVTAVVGTELLIAVDSQENTHVTCLEGKVQVQGDVGPQVTLDAGQWTDVRKGAAADAPTPFNWGRLKASETLLQPLKPGATAANDEPDPDDIWK